MDGRIAYTVLVALVGAERLVEVSVARRHDARLRAAGAIEVGSALYPWMVALHTAFLVSCLVEVWLLSRPVRPALGIAMLGALACAMLLRIWAVRALGARWTTRVLVVPGSERVTAGPYRFFRHPNYLAVAVEIVALPLVHSAWVTAIAFSVLNGMLLWARVRDEESALARWCVKQGSR